jgi:hypothetical protein
MEPVPEPTPETETTELTSIPLVTEDVPLETRDLPTAESTVDQTIMISALKLMLNAQVFHTSNHVSLDKAMNLPSMEQMKVTYGEEAEVNGDHSPHTTSGITTTVLKLFAEI